MTTRAKGFAVLAVQLLLVLSIAAKYAWERHTCPMVWVRATQFDPEQPLRGRYLALTLHADACDLLHDPAHKALATEVDSFRETHHDALSWRVRIHAQDGKLTTIFTDSENYADTSVLTLPPYLPCEYASLSGDTEYFIPAHARMPFPIPNGQQLWVLVTIPPSGPPRPVRLALTDATGFHPLDLR